MTTEEMKAICETAQNVSRACVAFANAMRDLAETFAKAMEPFAKFSEAMAESGITNDAPAEDDAPLCTKAMEKSGIEAEDDTDDDVPDVRHIMFDGRPATMRMVPADPACIEYPASQPIASPERIEADRARFVALLTPKQPDADEPTIIEKQP